MFELLAEYAWVPFTICTIAMLGGALTLMWHIRESNSGPYVLLLGCSLVFGGIGFLLGGMQAGDSPIISRTVLIPWVRFFWFLGGAAAVLFLLMYWAKRIDWTFVRRLRV